MIEMALKLILSCVLGGLIGLERGWRGKPAGMRTLILICFGSTLITIVSYEMVKSGQEILGDPARLAANIITGIGFLGAGTILQSRGGVHGLTTAATLWVTAALGISIGAGFYLLSAGSTLFILLVLTVFKRIEDEMEAKETLYSLSLRSTYPLENETILSKFQIANAHVQWLSQKKEGTDYTWTIEFRSKHFEEEELFRKALSLNGVEGFEFNKYP